MTIVRLNPANQPRRVIEHKVYKKATFAGQWTEVEDCHCDFATWSCAPNVSQARLYWRYGMGLRPGESAWQQVFRETGLDRYYIMIEMTDDEGLRLQWHGTCEINAQNIAGAASIGGIRRPSGRQHLTCYGLEQMLYDHRIVDSTWKKESSVGDTSLADTGADVTIDRAITFNAGGVGNKSKADGTDGPVFTGDLDGTQAEEWSSRDIIEYLVAYQMPRDWNGTQRIPFRLAEENLPPDKDQPILKQHGRSTGELFDAIFNRHRLMSWFVDVRSELTGKDTINIWPFSFNDQRIALDSGGQALPPNTYTRTVIFDDYPGIDASLKVSTLDAVDQVIVTGSRRRNCFTICKIDDTLEAAWKSTLETEYEEGASKATDYPAVGEKAARQRRDKEARSADRLANVYSRFRIPDDWDQKSYGGLGASGTAYPVNPKDNKPADAYPLYPREIFLLPKLPLLSGMDYSGNNIQNNTVSAVGDPPHEELPPIVLFQLPEDYTRYAHAETIGQTADMEDSEETTNRKWSARITVPPRSRTIVVKVNGQPQHAIAKDDFTRLSTDDPNVDRCDWQDALFTVAMEDDRFCEGRYPSDPVAKTDAVRLLRIDAGPDYKLDYVATKTVLGITPNTGKPIRTDTGGFIRDDRDALKALATLAYQWYSKPRASLVLDCTAINHDLMRGDLIDKIGENETEQTINSVITEVTVTIPRTEDGSPPEPPRIKYQTAFGELDPLRF